MREIREFYCVPPVQVSQVAFHSRQGNLYRFASVGLDAKLCVWEFLAEDFDGVWDVGQEGAEGGDAPTWWKVTM